MNDGGMVEKAGLRQVPAQLASLTQTLDQLSEAVIGLEQNLSVALTSPDPPDETADEPACPTCELAAAIKTSCRQAETILAAVVSMKARLEV